MKIRNGGALLKAIKKTRSGKSEIKMITTIIFDLGAVLIDWNPRHLYKQLFNDEAEMEHFLTNITTSDWNEEQDAGRSLQEGTEWLIKKHPEHEANIRAFYGRGMKCWAKHSMIPLRYSEN